jgi:hypothetical protein
MRRFIPLDILMRETEQLQKSVAADLSVPDPVPTPIVPQKTKKESAKDENSAEHDRGTGNIDDNASIDPTSK